MLSTDNLPKSFESLLKKNPEGPAACSTESNCLLTFIHTLLLEKET